MQLQPLQPPRNKTKREAKIDGCKTREKYRKNRGAKRERWGRGLPRNPRCKEAVERGRVTAEGSSAKRRPPHQWWLGCGCCVETRSWGTARDEGSPSRRLCSSAVRGQRSRRAVFILRGSEGARPLPTPQKPRLLAVGPGEFIHMQIWRDDLGPPPAAS